MKSNFCKHNFLELINNHLGMSPLFYDLITVREVMSVVIVNNLGS